MTTRATSWATWLLPPFADPWVGLCADLPATKKKRSAISCAVHTALQLGSFWRTSAATDGQPVACHAT
jgi:hypothetical protein